MSLARTQIRAQARAEYRAHEIVENKAPCGKTQKLRVALAGNNPSTGKRVFQAQRKYARMLKHARLVVGLLMRAAGGNVDLITQPPVYIAPAYQERIARLGTTITRRYPIETNPNARRNKKLAERRARDTESRGQRIARKGKVARANAQVLRDLAAGKYGKSGVEQAAEKV